MAFTVHGHQIPGSPYSTLPPSMKVSRCGGTGLCSVCSNESNSWLIQDLHDKAIIREKMEKEAQHIPANSAFLYQSKVVTVVAIRFTGGAGLGHDIVKWVSDNGGNASWRDSAKPHTPIGDEPGHDGWPEVLTIETSIGYREVKIGDWVIQNIDGEFHPCTDEVFSRKYEPKK